MHLEQTPAVCLRWRTIGVDYYIPPLLEPETTKKRCVVWQLNITENFMVKDEGNLVHMQIENKIVMDIGSFLNHICQHHMKTNK